LWRREEVLIADAALLALCSDEVRQRTACARFQNRPNPAFRPLRARHVERSGDGNFWLGQIIACVTVKRSYISQTHKLGPTP
jgi:hypothetical protein